MSRVYQIALFAFFFNVTLGLFTHPSIAPGSFDSAAELDDPLVLALLNTTRTEYELQATFETTDFDSGFLRAKDDERTFIEQFINRIPVLRMFYWGPSAIAEMLRHTSLPVDAINLVVDLLFGALTFIYVATIGQMFGGRLLGSVQ